MPSLAPIHLNLAIHRLATHEAVSLQSRLALVAVLRGEEESEILERLAEEERQPQDGQQHTVDKTA
jgi:hypothetical protein